MQQRLKTILAVLSFACAGSLAAQQNVELNVAEYKLNDADNVIELYIKAMEGGRGMRLKDDEIFFFETFENEKAVPLEIHAISQQEKEVEAEQSNQQKEKFTVLFLTALNLDGAPDFDTQRDQLVAAFSEKISTSGNTEYYLAAYGDVAHIPPKSFSPGELKNALAGYSRYNRFAELHQALAECVRYLKSKSGRRILVLLTDGKDKPQFSKYEERQELPYDTADIRQLLNQLDENFMIFPLGLGSQPDTDMMRFFTEATPNKLDTFSVGNEVPARLEDLLFIRRNLVYNNLVQLYPNPKHKVYRGEKRSIKVMWNGQEQVYDMSSIGSREQPVTVLLDKDYASGQGWLVSFLIGLALVALALGMMVWLVPWSRNLAFRKRYIVPYRTQSGVRKRDPLSGEPFQEGELVVVKCPHVTTSLNTWEYVGNKCPQYPRCLNFDPPCAGHGAPQSLDKFTSMTGIFRRLNWLWYGMVGGLIAWSVLALIHLTAYDGYYSLVRGLFRQSLAEGQTLQDLSRYIANLANELIMGASLGAGICFALSYIEEKSQPRRFSWLRVLARTGAGIVVSLLVFLLGFYLQYIELVPNRLIAGLLTWLLFGASMGALMSVESSISLWRGVLGGVVASLLAWVVYLLLLEQVFENNFPLAKLISLLALGGIFGITLAAVVASLEDFELEYLSPEEFRQTNHISKWLKQKIDVFIGTEEGSYVYVKWTDEQVKPRHARLHFEKGVVFVEPRAETLLNGNTLPMERSTPLRDGDVLQLGRESISRMRFRERRKAHTPVRQGGAPPSTPQSGKDEDGAPKIRFNQ